MHRNFNFEKPPFSVKIAQRFNAALCYCRTNAYEKLTPYILLGFGLALLSIIGLVVWMVILASNENEPTVTNQ